MKRKLFLVALLCSLCISSLRAADDTLLWGYTDNNFSALQGHGFSTQNVFGAAVLLTVDDKFDGATITVIDVPFSTEEAWEVTAFVASADDINTPLVSTFNDDGSSVGYNTYMFKEPYKLVKGKNVYVGYTFRIISTGTKQEKEPILTGGASQPGGLMVYNKKEWTDYSGEGWGNSGLQVRMKGAALPADYAVMGHIDDFGGGINTTATFPAIICGNSSTPIKQVGYKVDFGGKTTEGTADVNIATGFNQLQTINIVVPTPAEIGQYTATVTLTTVNGKPVTPSSSTALGTIYTRLVPRYTVMEEHTGTGCQHCTRGWAGMEYMKTHYDNYIAVSTHQHNQDDAMYNPNYPSLGLSAAPSCLLDRRTKALDPLYGSDPDEWIIGDFLACNAIMPEVEVHVSGTLQPDGKTVAAKASVDFLNNCPGCKISYVLTADGLTCPKNPDDKTLRMWRQANVFAKMETRNNFRGDGTCEIRNLYAEFAQGGKYGSTELTNLVFNDVMIGSSYTPAEGEHTDPLPADGKAGTTAENACNLPITCNEYGLAALKYDQIYVVAIVTDAEGHVANAGRARVMSAEGVGSVLAEPSTVDGQLSTSYDLAGHRLPSAPAGGLYIQNGKVRLAR